MPPIFLSDRELAAQAISPKNPEAGRLKPPSSRLSGFRGAALLLGLKRSKLVLELVAFQKASKTSIVSHSSLSRAAVSEFRIELKVRNMNVIIDNPVQQELEKLPQKTLIELIKMYSKNWLTVDGLWFSGVEEKFGLDEALALDVRMWRIGSRIEANRIKEILGLGDGGLKDVLRAINFMSWAASFGYHVEQQKDRAVWTCTHCPPQVSRVNSGKGEFACRSTFEYCFRNLCDLIDKRVRMNCLICPPDPHPRDIWCQWEFCL